MPFALLMTRINPLPNVLEHNASLSSCAISPRLRLAPPRKALLPVCSPFRMRRNSCAAWFALLPAACCSACTPPIPVFYSLTTGLGFPAHRCMHRRSVLQPACLLQGPSAGQRCVLFSSLPCPGLPLQLAGPSYSSDPLAAVPLGTASRLPGASPRLVLVARAAACLMPPRSGLSLLALPFASSAHSPASPLSLRLPEFPPSPVPASPCHCCSALMRPHVHVHVHGRCSKAE